MSAVVQPLSPAELVALVNDWAALPRQVDGRADPPLSSAPAGMRAAADEAFAVFAATSAAERVQLVNEMLADADVRPELRRRHDDLVSTWTVPFRRNVLVASAGLALREHLASHPDRLGVCDDDQCADVYLDGSPAGHRRFCSVTCQNRSRVAAFRQRRRGVSRA